MPRLTKIKKSKRGPVRQQDVFEFGPKIEVAARPVGYDTSVRAQSQSGGAAQALLEGLGLAGELVTKYGEARKTIDAAHITEGKLAGARKEPVNPGATEAFIKGHEMATGMGAVANFNNLMVQKHQELIANEASPQEYEKAMLGQEQKFMASGSDAYTEGAIRGGALEIQKNLSAEYAKAQFKRLQAKGLYNINGITDIKFQEIAAMPSLTSRDKMMQAIAARNVVTSLQELGMSQYNLDRNMVNASMTKHLAPIAQAQGNPAIFSYAFIDDGTGQKIINTAAGDAIFKAMDVAENQRRADVKTAEAKADKARKKLIEDAGRGMSFAMASGDKADLITATQNLMKLQDILPVTVIDKMVKDLQDFASGEGFAKVTDFRKYHELKEGAVDRTLEYDDLNDAKYLLEPNHYKEILDRMINASEKERTRTSGKADPAESTVGRARTGLKATLNVKNKFDRYVDPYAGAQRIITGGIFFDDLLERWQRGEIDWLKNPNKNKWPGKVELEQMVQKTQFEAYREHPQLVGKAPHYDDPSKVDKKRAVSAGDVDWDRLPADNIH